MIGTTPTNVRSFSAVKLLTFFAIAVPLFVGFVYYLTHSTPIYPADAQDARIGPVSKESVFQVNWENAYPPERTAFVYTYITGRWDDQQRLIGIRTSIESLKVTGTTRDIVVMVGSNVDEGSRQLLVRHGAKVMEMPHTPNDPINDMASTRLGVCKHDFAPIHAWSLHDKYDRVVWMDGDVLAQLKLDELFLCGEFCTVYMNLNWYISSIFVIKPDATMHAKLLAAASADSPATRAASAAFGEAGCQQAWEDFYMHQFAPIEAAPSFNPSKGQQHAPVMRLASGYALNPIFWYEKYDWSLARVKEYASMQGDTLGDVPAHALGFPRFKPWNWILCVYFNIHCLWAQWRYVLLNESFAGFLISYSLLVGAVAALSTALVPLVNMLYRDGEAAAPTGHLRMTGLNRVIVAVMRSIDKVGWTPIAYSFGIFTVFTTLVISWLMIPGSAIYFYAWPIYVCLSVVLCMFVLRLLALVMCASLTGRLTCAKDLSASSSSSSSLKLIAENMDRSATLPPSALCSLLLDATSFQTYLPTVLYWFLWYGVLQLEVYPHFVLKILVLLFVHAYLIVMLAAPYSAVLRLIYFAKAGAGVWRDV